MRWMLLILAGAALLAGCGAADGVAAPPAALTATVDEATDPTQGATAVAPTATAAASPTAPAATATAAASPTAADPTATVDDVTDPTPGATAGTAGAGATLLVSMRKTGGFAGIDEYMAVYTDGTIEQRARNGAVTRAQAPAADLEALRQLVASPEVAGLGNRYQAPIADAFTYQLELGGGEGKAKTIVVTVPSKYPPVLDQLLAQLEALRAQSTTR